MLKNATIRRKYNEQIAKGKVKEAKSFLSYEVNILKIHEKNSKSPIPGKQGCVCCTVELTN